MGKVGVNTHTQGICLQVRRRAGGRECGPVPARACVCVHLGMACVCAFKCVCICMCLCARTCGSVCVGDRTIVCFAPGQASSESAVVRGWAVFPVTQRKVVLTFKTKGCDVCGLLLILWGKPSECHVFFWLPSKSDLKCVWLRSLGKPFSKFDWVVRAFCESSCKVLL